MGKFRVELLPTEFNCDQIFDFVQNELNINEEHRRNMMYAYPRYRSDAGVRRHRAVHWEDVCSEASDEIGPAHVQLLPGVGEAET